MKSYRVLDLAGPDTLGVETELNRFLQLGWTVVCVLSPGRVLLRNWDDEGNVFEHFEPQ